MDKLGSDLVMHILGFCNPISVCRVLSLCKDYCNLSYDNSRILRLLNCHYPGLKFDYLNLGKNIDVYKFLTKVLTKKTFEEIIEKPENIEKYLSFSFYTPEDIYELLYQTTGQNYLGVISGPWETIKTEPIIWEHSFATYLRFESKYGKEKRLSKEAFEDDLFLQNAVEEFTVTMKKTIENFVKDPGNDITRIVWLNVKENIFDHFPYKTEDEHKASLLTFESRFQDYIIENTEENEICSIVNTQKRLYDTYSTVKCPFPSNLLLSYEQTIFLQILHSAVRRKVIGIYDELDFDVLMDKMNIKR